MVGKLPALLCVFTVAALFSQTQEFDFKQLQGVHCDNNTSTTSEMSYLRPLLCKSECRPRETFVQVWHEFPEEIPYIITPRCVPVQRCRGFCGDEALACSPINNDTVLVQVLRDTGEMIVLPFVQHSTCNCRPKRNLTDVCLSTD
uniref:Platelet-derived growth factor (PDGF) family profile domain-containing protein n=1 Tax=Astyanax mexicanus TaxID=7994 RepID=A0A3B1JFL6_ASTMX